MIKTYRSSKTIIKTSTKGGKGLFASEIILTDEVIAIRAGLWIIYKKNYNLDLNK